MSWEVCSLLSVASDWRGATAALAMTAVVIVSRTRRRRHDALGGAGPAEDDPLVAADDAEEGAAPLAGIPFGGTLLVAAGAADHHVHLFDLVHGVRASGGDGEPADLVDQGRARDAELVGGAGAVALVVREGALDVLALEVVEGEGHVAPLPLPAPRAELAREVVDGDGDVAAAEDEGALEDVAHLADVAGPGMGEEPFERLGSDEARGAGDRGPEVLEEPGDEREPVLARALAQRGELERHHVEAVVQ